MNGIEMKAEETGRPVIEKLGYELVETQYKDIYGNPTLTFFIYKKGGVTLDDCEAVSNALDGVMDENDVTDGKFYHLNVSSLGLDRPILTDDDFRRNIGEDVELIFVEKIGKKKENARNTRFVRRRKNHNYGKRDEESELRQKKSRRGKTVYRILTYN
jgi:ribosome maturation factor RimP